MLQHAQSQKFTVAVLADIHGNLAALRAVLADLATQSYDQLVIAGDLVMNGPHPKETLDCIRTLQVPTLFGETDRAVVEANRENALAYWTAEQIGTTGIAYLETLSFSQSIMPPQDASPENELLIVHATPTNVAAFLVLEPNSLDTRCATPTSEAEASDLLGETHPRLILHGHVHYASSGYVGNQQVVSIGAVGFPFDANPQAAYALVTWNGSRWEVIHRRVSYDYESVIAAVAHSGQPRADTIAHRLRTARWCPPLS
ncbi:metallophosphoesterase family protein [Dictyobacter formicarum]|uniref:Phosphoesterase n=1 Tax=Dictyobacter formicarum TaxID=2778368 RepID=A0ABQ3VH86_9CHLR|nr:metallophosphoesterase family protein [Dictyobacter formicarum]GHO85059.1 phosphoesterase [Dictyobacter formicarum]